MDQYHCNWCITLVTAASRQWLIGHQHSKSGQQEWPANHSKCMCIAHLRMVAANHSKCMCIAHLRMVAANHSKWWQQTTADGTIAQQESSADHCKGTSANFSDEWAWRMCTPASQNISMAEGQWAQQLVSSTHQIVRL